VLVVPLRAQLPSQLSINASDKQAKIINMLTNRGGVGDKINGTPSRHERRPFLLWGFSISSGSL